MPKTEPHIVTYYDRDSRVWWAYATDANGNQTGAAVHAHRKPNAVEQIACHWFALCPRPATGTTPHPVLREVQTCDKCHRFATGEDR